LDSRTGWDEEEDGPLLALKYVVNTRQHVMRFRCSLEGFPERLQRTPMLIPEDVVAMSSERAVEAALSGALYFNNEGSDAAFEACAQTLAERACESYVVGGKSLVYGLNLPFDRLVVACSGLSRDELHQLCGRVGRTCRSSSKAEVVFIDSDTAVKALTPGEDDRDGVLLFDLGVF
jgi:hypothetical protein